MTSSKAGIQQTVVSIAGFLNRARLGFPRHYFHGAGGIGDDLMCTTVIHELRRRNVHGIAVATGCPELFRQNPDVDKIIYHPRPRLNRWLREGLPFIRLGFADYDAASDRDEPLAEHVLVKICRLAGIVGSVQIRPYLHLSPDELIRGRLGKRQIVIQSSGRAAAFFMQNKEWYPDRFQEVCTALCAEHTVVQIGSNIDPVMNGAIDLRGRNSLRQSAAILANSLLFIGLEGFLMHLARAVNCRSVIVYGGHLRPWQIGYAANANLIGDTPCSPCWLRNRCDYDRACMKMIDVPTVLAATKEQIQRHGLPIEVEIATI